MAKTYGEVSLVVVPRYEEASSALNDELRNQRALVKGGVILGDSNNLSEDTRALLRQLLTSANEQTVLGQIQSNLLLIGPLLAALAALFAVGRKPKIGKDVESFGEKSAVSGREQEKIGLINMSSGLDVLLGRKPPPPSSEPLGDWFKVLDEDEDVTVWLRDGPKLEGTVDHDHRSATVLRLKNVDFTDPQQLQQTAGAPASGQKPDVLVPFAAIQLIIVRVPPPATPDPKQPD
jgi:hypothetical protein